MSTFPSELAREDRRYHWARENNRFLRFLVKDSREFLRKRMEIYSEQPRQTIALNEASREDNQERTAIQSEQLEVFSRVQRENTDAIHTLTGVAAQGVELQAKQFEDHQRLARETQDTVRKRYGNEARELRDAADTFLQQARGLEEGDQNLHLKEALRLLRDITKNPIGQGDYVTWYMIGCLVWLLDQDLIEAEEAFERARFLSVGAKNVWHVDALHDLAEIKHLRGKHTESYSTIQKALHIERNHSILFDAARYAAKVGAGRVAEVIKLLEECIEIQPRTIDTMLRVAEFQANQETSAAVRELANRLLLKMQCEVRSRLKQCRLLLTLIEKVQGETELTIPLPQIWSEDIRRMEAKAAQANYTQLLDMQPRVLAAIQQAEEAGQTTLKLKINEIISLEYQACDDASRLTRSTEERLSMLRKKMELAQSNGSTLHRCAILPTRPEIGWLSKETKSRTDFSDSVHTLLAVIFLEFVLYGLGNVSFGIPGAIIGAAIIPSCYIIFRLAYLLIPLFALLHWCLTCLRVRLINYIEERRRLQTFMAECPEKEAELESILENQVPKLQLLGEQLTTRRKRFEGTLDFFLKGCADAAANVPCKN